MTARPADAQAVGPLAWCARARPHAAETVCGDAFWIGARDGGAIAAVIDGLGHGPAAAAAAELVVRTVEERAELPIRDLFCACHAALRGSRGAVMAVGSFHTVQRSLTWACVGNVEGLVLRADGERHAIVQRGGVVGDRMPAIRSQTLALCDGDLVVFATDGLRPGFESVIDVRRPIEQLASSLIEEWSRKDDDALVLAMRWRGGAQ